MATRKKTVPKPNKVKKQPVRPTEPQVRASNRVDEFLKNEIALWANIVKTILQMLIGVVVLIVVLLHLIESLNPAWGFPIFQEMYKAEILAIIGYALLYASAIELAYTLFTPGPDEAVEPLITGLAAVILLGIAKIDFEKNPLTNEIVQDVAALVIILVIFFIIRKYLLRDKS